MRAAMETGIEIPKLCATDMLDAFGSCRLCLVEIEGRGGTPASCTMPVAEGIVVRTKSERLDRLRKGVMELYVSDHPVDSLDRAKHAGFDLLDTAAAVGLEEVRYGFGGARHIVTEDLVNEAFVRGGSISCAASDRPLPRAATL